MIKKFVFLIVMFLVGCVPVSHIIVGDTREPIDPSNVEIYLDYPCLLYTSPSPRD